MGQHVGFQLPGGIETVLQGLPSMVEILQPGKSIEVIYEGVSPERSDAMPVQTAPTHDLTPQPIIK